MRPFAFVALLLLSACSASHADGPPGGGRSMGRVPLSPAGELLGRMAPDEAAYADMLVDWAKGLDSNHDGFLSPEEVKPDIARFFRAVDSDKDGAINTRELGDYRQTRLAALRGGGDRAPAPPDGTPPADGTDRPPPPRAGTGGPGPDGPRGGMMMGGGGGADKVMEADRNLDFRVTPAELETLTLDRLRAMDSNQDGRTSLEEIRDAGSKAYNERPARGGVGGGRQGGGPPGGGRG